MNTLKLTSRMITVLHGLKNFPAAEVSLAQLGVACGFMHANASSRVARAARCLRDRGLVRERLTHTGTPYFTITEAGRAALREL